MRYDQVRCIKAQLAEKQDVEVERAGAEPAFRVAHPAKAAFDGQKRRKEPVRRPGRPQGQGHGLVAIGRLRGIPPGFGLVDRAYGRERGVRERGKTLPGRLESGQPVSQVGAEADMGGYSLAMRDRASSRRATGTVMAMRK